MCQFSWARRHLTFHSGGEGGGEGGNFDLILWLWNFVTLSFYLLAGFLQNFMVEDAINSKLWYFCRGCPIKFGYFSVVSILC